jgi:hypothetical protein
MIPTSAHAGITATRRRSGILAAVLAVIALVGLLGQTPAHAETTPSPSPTADGEVELAIAAGTNGVLAPGSVLTAQFSLQNGTGSRVSGGDAILQIGDAPLDDGGELTAWTDGSGTAATGRVLGSIRVETVLSGETTGGILQVPGDHEALAGRAPGVYPLRLTLGEREARSVVVVSGAVSGSVGLVVPITAGPLQRGLLSRDRLEQLTAPDGALTALLDGVEGTPAILAVDPAVPAAIRVLGTAAPASAQEWLVRLLQLPNARFALQFGDADVATQIDGGLDAPWQPTSLASYVDADAIAVPAETASPEATDETGGEDAPADAATLPDLATLLDIGDSAAPVIYWPAAGAAGPDVVSTLATTVPGALTVLSSDTVTADAGPAPSGRAAAGEAGLLVTDAAASAALRAGSAEDDGAQRGAHLAEASAQLTLAAAAADGAPVLVTLDRANDRSALALRAAIDAAGLPGLSAADLDAVLSADPRQVTVTDVESDPARSSAVGVLSADAERIAQFATILDDPDLLTGPDRAAALQILGAGWTTDGADWDAAFAAHRAATEETLGSVGILPSSPLNLLTAGTDLRFWVHNELPYPVNVVMHVDPNDLRLEVDRQSVVTAAPDSNTPVPVPVRARIGNGDVKITLSLRSPTFQPIGDPQTVDVNVRADWEGIGLVVMGVLIAGFLVIGVVRTVRRRRRTAETDSDGGAAETDPDAGVSELPSGTDPRGDRE